jgi:hypothetical protein
MNMARTHMAPPGLFAKRFHQVLDFHIAVFIGQQAELIGLPAEDVTSILDSLSTVWPCFMIITRRSKPIGHRKLSSVHFNRNAIPILVDAFIAKMREPGRQEIYPNS